MTASVSCTTLGTVLHLLVYCVFSLALTNLIWVKEGACVSCCLAVTQSIVNISDVLFLYYIAEKWDEAKLCFSSTVSKFENRCAFGNWVVRRACIFSCLGFECQRRVSALIHVENSKKVKLVFLIEIFWIFLSLKIKISR